MTSNRVDIIELDTPEGVPEDSEYFPPEKEPPDNAQVHESPYGGTYVTYPDDSTTDEQNGESPDFGGYDDGAEFDGEYSENVEDRLRGISYSGDNLSRAPSNNEIEDAIESIFPDDDRKNELERKFPNWSPDNVDIGEALFYEWLFGDIDYNDVVAAADKLTDYEFSEERDELPEVDESEYEVDAIQVSDDGRTVAEERVDNIEISELDESASETVMNTVGTIMEKYDVSVDEIVQNDEQLSFSIGKKNAHYSPGLEQLYFNPEIEESDIKKYADRGWHVPESFRDLSFHEMMHKLHQERKGLENVEKGQLTEDDKELLEEEVSEYSAENEFEAVAEIGTKLLKGEDVSERILRIYKMLGGPKL
jgi:hypothetical protein